MQTRALFSIAFLSLLSACSDRQATAAETPGAMDNPADQPLPASVTQGMPKPAPVPLPGPGIAVSTIPADVIVSTNEPFWQARVEGATVVLASPQGERRMEVESNEGNAEGRRVIARDAKGRLDLQVTTQACEDDMSGMAFPFTGTLSFDGAGVIRGCARGASMPMPREAF